ncbi:glucose-1-phosphate cytidylyltransferase [Phyllobacterium brassicacearum]|uniref:Glucose-1-phosphate cytidylyltransferase n=1 Tax=Phyllobacterium brassicacearum TaxID=314235 RepID=A0A2P7BNU4_9HYPH|nr:glucose-1-phosphate cytidylyltransferase [Phyllobacterium brassicacearum]PSH68122.1 glucose-1-phosphate cytidylyltransferase [Phyllobacterium brassicacearum]TDQ29652.1 glucose-1-phosphate cytidylyltransferase [Phyllobacterium brassicacearum]
MKVVIFAGGFGTRLTEETTARPKPMVEIGGRPIIWHIMKTYAHYGFTEFIVLAGYKAEVIKSYFLNYFMINSDFTIDLGSGEIAWKQKCSENWKVTVLDTGLDTMTGGRLKRARDTIGEERFLLTYGDGVSDTNILESIKTHELGDNWVTLTAVTQPGRYGALGLSEDARKVRAFREKVAGDGGLINGGFFVCEPQVFDLIDGDETVWEEQPMEHVIERGKLGSHWHHGYWQSMDSLRDKAVLEKAWSSGRAPWKVWS